MERIQRKARLFDILDGVLYKRSFHRPYLKCLTPERDKVILKKVNEGICRSHIGAGALAEQIMRTCYCWSTLKIDTLEYVKKYERCQKYAPIPRRPATHFSPNSTPLSFFRWGMDILGLFYPASGQRKFLIFGIDYFTKWIKAEPTTTIKATDIKRFIWKNIMIRYGIPLFCSFVQIMGLKSGLVPSAVLRRTTKLSLPTSRS